jgi:hypothetical protein
MVPVSTDTLLRVVRRRRVVALLPDREVSTVAAWLSQPPEIEVVSRDRGGRYGEATTKALPGATQVADRWHLMENASATFLDAVQRSVKERRGCAGGDRRVSVGSTRPFSPRPPIYSEMPCPEMCACCRQFVP